MRTITSIFKRVIGMTFLIFVTWTMTSAYTIVFYGGKRVEIPDNFIVTSNAVIYEAAPDVNISYLLTSIDIPATEHANNDAAGTFLGRTGAPRVEAAPFTTTTQKATRTITNRDLEPYQSARVRSEATSAERRKDLGLPTLEEVRSAAARRDAALDEFLAKKRVEQEAIRRQEFEAQLLMAVLARTNATPSQAGSYYWPTGSFFDAGVPGAFDSSFRFGRRFPVASPCGFNPSAACLMSHPFSLFNQGGLPSRRSFFVAPRTVGGRRGGAVFVSPGRRH